MEEIRGDMGEKAILNRITFPEWHERPFGAWHGRSLVSVHGGDGGLKQRMIHFMGGAKQRMIKYRLCRCYDWT